MPHTVVTFISLAALALATACKSSPAPEAAPAPAEAPPVAAEPPPTPTPVEPAAAPVASPPVATAPVEASPLRVVAVREGNVGFLRHRDTPVLTLEGEPVPWADGAFTRRPNASVGLSPKFSSYAVEDLTLTFAGSLDEPQGAWTTTARHFDRSASIYATYHRTGDQWQAMERRKGMLLAHYAAVVERDGAVLALQQWAVDPEQDVWSSEDESRAAKAHFAKVRRSLARTKSGWIRIAGAEIDVPRIPGELVPTAAMADERGVIFALARKSSENAWDDPSALLTWPLGTSEAERVDVPDLDRASYLRLANNGEWTLITGFIGGREGEPSESYLAVGHAGQWQRVTVSLPGRPPDSSVDLTGAARAPDGELWIAFGRGGTETQPIWRKPVDGDWQPVPLPTVDHEAFGPHKGWVRDSDDEERGWVEIERGPSDAELLMPTSIGWAAGAVWVTARLGAAYGSRGIEQSPSRIVVLTSHPKTAPIATLPSTWELQLERRDHLVRDAKPGDEACRSLSLVLGPATLATSQPAAIAAIQVLEPLGEGGATIESLYTATLDGAEVLVAASRVAGPEQATALRVAVAAASGLTPSLDCRIPRVGKMLGGR